ncbi:uncharacterized protein MONOS_16258 [Monocercomonoides exilis]|uniref:uncharacterized protein n=1 Tax=Monocercomonoides exilis TaxID=2049356 RepID=UPI00355A87E5|nr:hypothetical protein MONOS_16258 [Monocercomonoides exilis]|eukprot:MONOS_16258.1-p1 / transcript=MONOS_16258.1 / gene=MONOS_16258 / organism=Monocercomonoides_exilis_PA203 / gene_product=unspecified product / transcript_product=unspecified product / location=Mono_scaffold01596:770-976(+) / protein_length=69 / sequence_SO=supercontig / SO=protein_coding / is_pseudo=false
MHSDCQKHLLQQQKSSEAEERRRQFAIQLIQKLMFVPRADEGLAAEEGLAVEDQITGQSAQQQQNRMS